MIAFIERHRGDFGAEPSRRHRSEPDGEGRSAVFCRSPRQPSIAMLPSPGTRSLPRSAPGRMPWTSRRSRRSTARAAGATVPARSGISFGVTDTTSRVAPWSGSCIFMDDKGLCGVRRRRPSPIQRSLAPMTRSTGSSWRPCPTSSGASHCAPSVRGVASGGAIGPSPAGDGERFHLRVDMGGDGLVRGRARTNGALAPHPSSSMSSPARSWAGASRPR